MLRLVALPFCRVAMVAPGRVPLRGPDNDLMGYVPAPGWDARYDWAGWVPASETPREFDPQSGWLASANQRAQGSAVRRRGGLGLGRVFALATQHVFEVGGQRPVVLRTTRGVLEVGIGQHPWVGVGALELELDRGADLGRADKIERRLDDASAVPETAPMRFDVDEYGLVHDLPAAFRRT